MYKRILPRDLFNEAKLLKCLGQLVLLIEDGVGKDGKRTPPLKYEHHRDETTDGFDICQSRGSGDIYCDNLIFFKDEIPVDVFCTHNSKKTYPLVFIKKGGEEGDVFNDDGTLTDEFCEHVNAIQPEDE